MNKAQVDAFFSPLELLRNTSLFGVSLNSSFMAHNSVTGLVKITRPIQNYSTSDPNGHMEWPHYLERPNFTSGVTIWILFSPLPLVGCLRICNLGPKKQTKGNSNM